MIPTPQNEPVLSYAVGTPERDELKRALKESSARVLEIPVVEVGARRLSLATSPAKLRLLLDEALDGVEVAL